MNIYKRRSRSKRPGRGPLPEHEALAWAAVNERQQEKAAREAGLSWREKAALRENSVMISDSRSR